MCGSLWKKESHMQKGTTKKMEIRSTAQKKVLNCNHIRLHMFEEEEEEEEKIIYEICIENEL